MNYFADLLLKKNNSKTNDQVPFIQRRRGIEIKSSREINLMKKSSRIVATVLREISDLIKPGMSTKDLDDFAEKRIKDFGAVPSFKGYHGFPSSICSSINNEVVHGIPNKNKIIRNGDLVKIDTGAYLDGFHGDSCISICVGDVTLKAKKLSDVALQALNAGLSKIRAGNTLLDVAGAIEDVVNKNGPNYVSTVGILNVVDEKDNYVTTLEPEKRFFPTQSITTTEASIDNAFSRDIYIVLGAQQGEFEWVVRTYIKPFVNWIWLGAFILSLGGMLSIFDKKVRIGIASRKEQVV